MDAPIRADRPDYAMCRWMVEGSFEAARAKGAVTAEELKEYWTALEAWGNTFFAMFPGFVVGGRKPA